MRTIIGLDKSVYLQSIDATISMKSIFRNAIGLKAQQVKLDF